MLINRYASSFFTVSKSFRAFSTNHHSLFKKQALEELLPFKSIFRSNQNLIHNAILPKQCFLRDVFREVKQSTDITNSLSILSQLQADDVEVGFVSEIVISIFSPCKDCNAVLAAVAASWAACGDSLRKCISIREKF